MVLTYIKLTFKEEEKMFKSTSNKYWKNNEMERISKEKLSDKEKDFDEFVLKLMRALAENSYSKVTFYPYRTAMVFDKMFDADRDYMCPLEYMLAIKAGVSPDNHTVYEVYNGFNTFYIFCSDQLLSIGKTIQKERW